jgi:hypothetical protein
MLRSHCAGYIVHGYCSSNAVGISGVCGVNHADGCSDRNAARVSLSIAHDAVGRAATCLAAGMMIGDQCA